MPKRPQRPIFEVTGRRKAQMDGDVGATSEVVVQPRSRSKLVHLKAEHRDQLLLLLAELRKDPNSFPF